MDISLGGTPIIELQERWYSEIRRGRAFAFSDDRGPTVGSFSHIQLFNPAASGVIVITRYAVFATGAGAALEVHTWNTAAVNLSGTGVNLLNGGAGSAARVRWEDNAARQGTSFLSVLVAASDARNILPDWICELDAGEGLTVVPNATNVRLIGGFFWIELPV